MAKRPRTRVRACADDLHEVKDLYKVGSFKFLLLMGKAIFWAGNPRFCDGLSFDIKAVKTRYGFVIYTSAVFDWPARKIATRLKFLPEHGYWSDNKLIEILARRYRFPWF